MISALRKKYLRAILIIGIQNPYGHLPSLHPE
jgi:hypothetical protein